jgi:hypothetical protein
MTTEKNETPAPKKPEIPRAHLDSPPEEPEYDDDILRKDVSLLRLTAAIYLTGRILKTGCFTLLIIFAAFIGCCSFIDSRYHHDADRIMGNASDCLLQLKWIGESLYYLTHPDKIPESLRGEIELVEVTPDMTVADLIREALRQEILKGKYLCCARTGEPYLVFPAPASVLLLEDDPRNPHDRIPIVIDPPDAHQESKSLTFVCRLFFGYSAKYISTARVLYADGGIVTISSEEAERLVRKYHPESLKMPQDETTGEMGAEDAMRVD